MILFFCPYFIFLLFSQNYYKNTLTIHEDFFEIIVCLHTDYLLFRPFNNSRAENIRRCNRIIWMLWVDWIWIFHKNISTNRNIWIFISLFVFAGVDKWWQYKHKDKALKMVLFTLTIVASFIIDTKHDYAEFLFIGMDW